MRLAESEVIAGLRHPSVYVRDTVVDYLKDCARTEADVTRRIVAAVEQFGWRNVLNLPHRIASFELDETTLPWAIEQIERTGAEAPSENMRWHLARMLARAPVDALRPQLERVLKLEVMQERRTKNPGYHRTNADLLELRCELRDKSPEECWDLLEVHCRAVAGVEEFADADIVYAEALVERIASAGSAFAGRVMDVLERIDAPDGGYQDWLLGLAMRTAGLLRIEAAAPLLYRHFAVDWDWYNEAIQEALVRIGTPSVTRLVSEHYADSPDHFRIYSWGVFEAVHHDEAISHILRVVPDEEDEGMRGQLGVALASHFDEAAIQPALALYNEEPDDPERFTIIERLYAHGCLAELELPQMDEWEQQIEKYWRRFNKGFDRLKPLIESYLDQEDEWPGEDWADEWSEDDDGQGGEVYPPKIEPIVHDGPRVGRNDPCPCGSGKKYKKCCLRVDSR